MNAYELSTKAQKAIGYWSKDDFYIYFRPTTSKHAEPTKPEGQWWVVSVQIRSMPPHEFRAEGRVLDEVILDLAARIPRRKDLKTYIEQADPNSYIGFLAPHEQWKRKYKSVVEDPESSELLVSAYKADKKSKKRGVPVERRGEGRPKNATDKGWNQEVVEKAKKKNRKKKK